MILPQNGRCSASLRNGSFKMSDPHPNLIKTRVPEMVARRTRDGDEILFRRLDPPVASWCRPSARWAVEYWRKDMAFPVAQAWVFVSPSGVYIDWLHVMEFCRRQGVGKALFAAIRGRWPDVEFDAVTEAGEAFLNCLAE
jgi:GNAT superfamily N-acetyltransferase